MSTQAETIFEALQLVPWFAASGSASVQSLARQCHLVNLGNNEEIARRGQSLQHLVVIAAGRLESSMTSPVGKHHIVGYLTRGMAFGLIPVLDEKPCIHDARAQGAASVVLMPRLALMEEMARNPILMHGAFQLLCSRSRMVYGSLSDQSLLSTQARVARQLLMLATGYGNRHQDSPAVLTIELPQSSLADMLGITRQSLNIELKRLEKNGWIRIAYSRIELLNRRELQNLTN